MKYSFILEIDDISKDDMNELISVLANNHIKFHVLKSDKELNEIKKYKEVINKAIKWVQDYMNEWDFYDEVYHDINDLLVLLKEVEHGED